MVLPSVEQYSMCVLTLIFVLQTGYVLQNVVQNEMKYPFINAV